MAHFKDEVTRTGPPITVIGGDLSADAFDEVRPIVVEALQALSDLKSCWERDSARLLPMSP